MKVVFNILMFILYISIHCQQQEYRKIFWSENYKLNWADFKQKSDSLDSEVAALSFCGIQYSSCINNKKQKYTYEVSSFFVPELSWGRIENNSILEHEQLHFDIAELYARRLRKSFSEGKVEPKDSKMKFFTPIFKEYVEFQNLYDKETRHGVLKEENKKWRDKIRTELRRLNTYRGNRCY